MNLKLVSIVALAASTFFAVSAHAGGTLGAVSDTDNYLQGDSFSGLGVLNGDWTFTLGNLGPDAGAYDLTSFAVTTNPVVTGPVSATFALYNVDTSTLLETVSFNGNGPFVTSDFSTLAGNGNYKVTIAGFGAAQEGSFTVSATAVPEPESYAMMIAGLGAMGFLARRRKNSQV